LPTEAEWNTEQATWTSDDRAGAFASPLKLTAAGGRQDVAAGTPYLESVGVEGYYWSNTTIGDIGNRRSRLLNFWHDGFSIYTFGRYYGFSVRCIKD